MQSNVQVVESIPERDASGAHLDTILDFWGILKIPQEFAN